MNFEETIKKYINEPNTFVFVDQNVYSFWKDRLELNNVIIIESSEENKTSDDTIKDMLVRSLQYAQAQTANLKEDTANQLTPTLKDVSSAAVDIKKIVDERNNERSPYRPEDNELQKLISRNKVPDSLNMPEILEVSEDTDQLNVNGPAQVEGTEDATEENLNELFSDSSED